MIKVSLICPIFNSEPYLNELINSIHHQSMSFFECIMIDDCSDDQSFHVLESIQDPRFKIIRNNQNLGAQKTRELGFSIASGDYIAFIDGDDFLAFNYIEELYKKITSDLSEIVMCQYEVVDETSQIIRHHYHVTPVPITEFPTDAIHTPHILLSKPAFWNKLFARKFLERFISFPEVLIAQDLAIVPYLLSKARISYVSQPLYFYRNHSQSISTHYDERILNIQETIRLLFNQFQDDFKNEIEFLALSHLYFQVSKALYIRNSNIRLMVYTKLVSIINMTLLNFKRNIYYRRRPFYKLSIFMLNRPFFFKYQVLNSWIRILLKSHLLIRILRIFDK